MAAGPPSGEERRGGSVRGPGTVAQVGACPARGPSGVAIMVPGVKHGVSDMLSVPARRAGSDGARGARSVSRSSRAARGKFTSSNVMYGSLCAVARQCGRRPFFEAADTKLAGETGPAEDECVGIGADWGHSGAGFSLVFKALHTHELCVKAPAAARRATSAPRPAIIHGP